MKLRVVSSRNEILYIDPDEKMVHLAFRASSADFLNLIQRCPRLQMVQIPPSYHKTMSNAVELALDTQCIELLEGHAWGHRKDLDEYFTVEGVTIEEIKSLASSGVNIDELASKIARRMVHLSPDLIKYIARTKIPA